MNDVERFLAWIIYTGALEGRKQREHQHITRKASWLASLQQYARDLGDRGMVL